MRIDPRLAALRGDDAPQRCDDQALAQALADWRTGPLAEGLDAEIESLSRGTDLEQLPLLASLFDPASSRADRFTGDLVVRLGRVLAHARLGQVPLRHFCDDTLAMLILARRGNVTLALQAIDGQGAARRPVPASASFAPGQTWEKVLSGRAEARLIEIAGLRPGGAELAMRPLLLQPGDLSCRDGARQVVQFGSVDGVLVSLKLQRRETGGEPTREYALADGALLHQAANCARDSRLELALTLLGRMGRADAAPYLAAMAEESGNPSLRWQALRECLGLDTVLGFATLGAVARRADDMLSGPAGALRAQLLEAYPQLAAIEAGGRSCPA